MLWKKKTAAARLIEGRKKKTEDDEGRSSRQGKVEKEIYRPASKQSTIYHNEFPADKLIQKNIKLHCNRKKKLYKY